MIELAAIAAALLGAFLGAALSRRLRGRRRDQSFRDRTSRRLRGRRRDQWFRDRIKPMVVVHTKDGQSIKGAAVDVSADMLFLDHAEFLSGGQITQLGGRVSVPRSNVSWIQDLPAGETSQ